MTVFVCRVGVYANLYIFHCATMTCPAEINTNRGLALHKLPTERVVDKRRSSDSQDQLGQIQQGIQCPHNLFVLVTSRTVDVKVHILNVFNFFPTSKVIIYLETLTK